MRVFHFLSISIMVMFFLSNTAPAQVVSKEVSSDSSGEKALSMFGVEDMVQAAGDFRRASEALERFGGMLEGIVMALSEVLVDSSRNYAKMSESFDPFGFKMAFKTICEQGKTIQRLQKAEIRRLRKECREMKKRLGRRDRKRRKRKIR